MKANNMRKTLICSAVLAMGVSSLAQANVVTADFAFTTVPDVAIAESVALDFGSDLRLGTGTTCVLSVNDTAGPGSTAGRYGPSTPTVGTFQQRSGDCEPAGLGNSTGTAGVYDITGANGVQVDIVVNPILPNASNNFAFVPTATAVNYDNGADNDNLVTFAAGAGSTATGTTQLATSSDTGVGSPIPGQTKLFVGGTLTAQQQLTAGTTYNLQQFSVDVVYN
jgi:hypothetical protein